jgi:hypothetical protein
LWGEHNEADTSQQWTALARWHRQYVDRFCVFWRRSDVNLNRILFFSTTGESSVYTLKMKRPSKGTVHFDCEDIDVIDQQQQKQQQLKVDNECNNFDSKSIDWSLSPVPSATLDQNNIPKKCKPHFTYTILWKETLTTSSWWTSTNDSQSQRKKTWTDTNQRFLIAWDPL